jgi:crotonobetainyl-CoA:carnitine CoA-transferase CaiB-like acyl-CoA transferase
VGGPLEGARVVEFGGWVVGPSTTAVLADWGAEVVKIEPPGGDPNRAWVTGANPTFELDNRGKRSIMLDLGTEGGRDVVLRLLGRADVFVTNVRQPALSSFGLDYESLADRFPRLVYALITGYGRTGPERDRAAYDSGAFWARAGVLRAMTAPGSELPLSPGGSGDHVTSVTTVAGIAAALVARERTGRGQLVSTSLLRAGIFTVGSDVNRALRLGEAYPVRPRTQATNPLFNSYRCRDGEYLFLLGLQPDRHWEPVARALGRPELLDDRRFSTSADRAQHAPALIEVMGEAFATADRADWGAVLDAHGVWWSPVQSPGDVPRDEQAVASGAFVEAPTADGPKAMVSSPVDFSDTSWSVTRRAPETGEHTEEVLLELGLDWDDITALRDRGALG